MKFKLIFLKAEGLSKVCIVFGLNSTFFSKRTYNQSTFFFLWNRSTNQHEITSLMRLKDTFSNLSSCLDIAAHIHSQESYNNLIQAKQIHNYPKVCQETDRRCRGKRFSDDILGFFLVQIGNSAPDFDLRAISDIVSSVCWGGKKTVDLIKLNGAVCLMERCVGCGLTAGHRCPIIPEKTRSRHRVFWRRRKGSRLLLPFKWHH